jgi:anti-sigma regulatory factor (Ser/Thr protein kinase)
VSVVAGVSERAEWLVLPHHARGAAVARRHLHDSLLQLGVHAELAADAVVVASELIGNAVRHARPQRGGVVTLSWWAKPHLVEVRVADGGALGAPTLRDSAADAIDGRGLAIVAALAERWGTESDDDGRLVWARLTSS